MRYTPTNWANGKAPAINADNLNKIENELVALDEGFEEVNQALQTVQSDVSGLKEADATINQTLQTVQNDVEYLKENGGGTDNSVDITETTETTMPNSCEGRLRFNEIRGKTEQGANPSPTNQQEIRSVAISKIKTHGKNLLENTATSQTINGVTFTVHKNGTVTVNGTAIETASISINIGTYPSGNYVFSGCPSGGSYGETYYMIWSGPNWSPQARDSGNGANLTLDKETNMTAFINVFKGTTVNNLVFKPMIRKADIEDATYEPYCGSSFTFSQLIELNNIGDVQDVIVDGKPIRRIGEYTVPSDVTVTIYDDVEGISRFRINASPKQVTNDADLLSEYFSGGYTLQEINDLKLPYQTCIYGKELWFTTQRGEYTTASFKEFIVGKKIYYTLETETTEALPTEDQVALNSIDTFDGTTYLEIDSPLEPEFIAEYGTSKVGGVALESLLVARNNEIRISALETSAVNNI